MRKIRNPIKVDYKRYVSFPYEKQFNDLSMEIQTGYDVMFVCYLYNQFGIIR